MIQDLTRTGESHRDLVVAENLTAWSCESSGVCILVQTGSDGEWQRRVRRRQRKQYSVSLASPGPSTFETVFGETYCSDHVFVESPAVLRWVEAAALVAVELEYASVAVAAAAVALEAVVVAAAAADLIVEGIETATKCC